MSLQAKELKWLAGGRMILQNISFAVQPGEFLGIVGPNGSGKSSLMALLAGIRKAADGIVLIDGKELRRMGRRAVAQRLAFVEQQAETMERIRARQAVELGRTPHLGPLSAWSADDEEIVDQALESVEMTHMQDRFWHTLSGGERQRLHIARALAQQPSILLLDEPTNHLDIHHQLALLELVKAQGLTVIVALHDLNHAAMFCDRIIMMNHGKIICAGAPRDVLTRGNIASVFNVQVHVEAESDGSCHIRYERSFQDERNREKKWLSSAA
ncbi:ABC transporter ATP-binding protein [Limoniibacter endophyticus]|uniref:Histidinol-phosphatase n=1 Tax=Limoniibacter endophyticus TaxID=1565040 RepID=A0A8J3GII0_9HYPH|nr:ABC transporter ATP-binding protein [Limoniibacter endophyticus]GHC77263.1 histidinol-phosphatase [Limoniibacter endophyticus]